MPPVSSHLNNPQGYRYKSAVTFPVKAAGSTENARVLRRNRLSLEHANAFPKPVAPRNEPHKQPSLKQHPHTPRRLGQLSSATAPKPSFASDGNVSHDDVTVKASNKHTHPSSSTSTSNTSRKKKEDLKCIIIPEIPNNNKPNNNKKEQYTQKADRGRSRTPRQPKPIKTTDYSCGVDDVIKQIKSELGTGITNVLSRLTNFPF